MEWCFRRGYLEEHYFEVNFEYSISFQFGFRRFYAFVIFESETWAYKHLIVGSKNIKCKYSTQNIIDKLAQNISKHSYRIRTPIKRNQVMNTV